MLEAVKFLILVTLVTITSQSYNQPSPSAEIVSCRYVKRIIKDPNVLIVDVRKPYEIEETGVITGAVNIPLDDLEDALTCSDEEFFERYNRPKPLKIKPIIFYCTDGVRSTEASSIASYLGFRKIKNFEGGWPEWEGHCS